MPPISSVLIIDDEDSVRQVLVDIFREEGVPHICDVPSAEKAMETLEREPFSLIICDYHLQGMNGIAFMGKLRVKGDQTPILLITGVPDKTPVMQAAMQLKADFLAKPFSISQLMGVVERLMSA
ncbi:MAG: response regulator [Verrucomicrobia bacterium]|nr:response regulator [Verrucomicrobiota bacterium]